ncbi:M15 family metallopeptidase [Vibrio tapetis subsp. quintayensis]|uniref:M15 family metallopeptidase n=1 Tax=Vibrio tapetis TaxID=52443 RepID=UPI0025B37972|nr:M15 family metallopeptidase [Vibrio tapetis]MDN3682669.1 M15 family metallopeptidase [Vibrio tapetis subsp. quintayensis]
MNPEQLTGKSVGHLIEVSTATQTLSLHHQMKQAWLSLYNKAKQDGFELCIASGFRDFSRQRAIWNGKFSGERVILSGNGQPLDAEKLTDNEKMSAILKWSALPGASRHHWGCDIDVYAKDRLPNDTRLMLEPWEYDSGHQQEFNDWMQHALPEFDFFLPYDVFRGGVAAEPWHISYAPVSVAAIELLTPDIIHTALIADPILGQQSVLSCLDDIYRTYVTNIGDTQWNS